MNQIDIFINFCKNKPDQEVTLRQVFSGRGAQPTKDRKKILECFSPIRTVQGVQFDPKRGVFVYSESNVH